jgi:hypothetical protein
MKTVVSVALMLAVAGCSSAPKMQAQKPQYCHTSQDIVVRNGERVDSVTLVRCDDDQLNRITERRLGLSTHCGEFTYWTKIGGKDVQRKGISCQKPDGSWEVINTVGR